MARRMFRPSERAQRRDQRRPVSRTGTINGVEVELFDLSLTGIGVGTLSFEDVSKLDLKEGEQTTIELPGPDGEKLSLSLEIQRVDREVREIGATFAQLSDEDFDAIEKLMFPRRVKAAAKAKV